MSKFEENYEKFDRRVPKKRFVKEGFAYLNRWDTTHIRFVDQATIEEILQEYELIKKRESDLSAKERGIIIKMVENGGE